MKTYPILLALLSLTALTFQGCIKDKCESTITYTRLDPVYKTLEEVHNTTAVREAARPLKTPGQINYFDDRMFVVETGEGIHVIDNHDPANPVNTDFINVPGATDLAIKDGYLYTNSYVDLLVINLEDYAVAGRAENVLQPLWSDLATGNILVEYKETEVTEVMECGQQDRLYYNGGRFFGGGAEFEGDLVFAADNAAGGSGYTSSGKGIGGSLSHFTIISDYLYTIQHGGYDLQIYDLTQPTAPTFASTVSVGAQLETLFPYGDKLFIGSNVGMYIYDNSNPLAPVQLSVFEHARACDPVFVNDHYAYVTLWDGSSCGSGPNQLDVIDIDDLMNPVLLKSFPMKNPHGLSVKGNHLLLCEGDYGFEIYDNTDPATVGDHLLDKAEEYHALDVISLPGTSNVAMVIGEDGFYQYDFNDPTNLKLLSIIPIEGE